MGGLENLGREAKENDNKETYLASSQTFGRSQKAHISNMGAESALKQGTAFDSPISQPNLQTFFMKMP